MKKLFFVACLAGVWGLPAQPPPVLLNPLRIAPRPEYAATEIQWESAEEFCLRAYRIENSPNGRAWQPVQTLTVSYADYPLSQRNLPYRVQDRRPERPEQGFYRLALIENDRLESNTPATRYGKTTPSEVLADYRAFDRKGFVQCFGFESLDTLHISVYTPQKHLVFCDTIDILDPNAPQGELLWLPSGALPKGFYWVWAYSTRQRRGYWAKLGAF